MQIETTGDTTNTPIRIAKILKTHNTKFWRRCGTTRTLIYFRWEYKIIQPLWEKIGLLLIKLNRYILNSMAQKFLN